MEASDARHAANERQLLGYILFSDGSFDGSINEKIDESVPSCTLSFKQLLPDLYRASNANHHITCLFLQRMLGTAHCTLPSQGINYFLARSIIATSNGSNGFSLKASQLESSLGRTQRSSESLQFSAPKMAGALLTKLGIRESEEHLRSF